MDYKKEFDRHINTLQNTIVILKRNYKIQEKLVSIISEAFPGNWFIYLNNYTLSISVYVDSYDDITRTMRLIGRCKYHKALPGSVIINQEVDESGLMGSGYIKYQNDIDSRCYIVFYLKTDSKTCKKVECGTEVIKKYKIECQ